MAKTKNSETSAATVGYEAHLWQMADALRGSMDAAEYKHIVLGLIFLKYISDAFEEQCAYGDTFHNDRHSDLKADFILANLAFEVSDWGGERLRDDKLWQYGVPPVGNARFVWVHSS